MYKLKQFILKKSPRAIKNLYYNIKSKRGERKSAPDIFCGIKDSNAWGGRESVSGPGSENIPTKVLEAELPKLFEEHKISRMLDIPCGDFNWMKKVALTYAIDNDFSYIGADIVQALILENEKKYASERISFLTLNVISDELPCVDMVFVRDCFVHLSYKDIQKAIKNIKKSGSKFLMATTFVNHHDNHNIPTGHWRPINLQDAPFGFPKPAYVLMENCTEGNGAYSDKAMGLWRLEDI